MDAMVRRERGSVLIITVVAMLILGVLSVSFTLLAGVETRIGVNFKQQAQAEALAEAGLEVARDAVRTAASVPGGFTPWLGGALLAPGVPLGPGQYWARIDNDCAPLVPAAIQQPGGCNVNGPDTNEVGVITAWATAGVGRSRVRAVVGVDNPWKHVCSDAKPDGNGYCNDPSNANGTPTTTPADPNDPNGPSAYDDLPRPILGCSRIDPTMHGATLASCPPGTTYSWDPATTSYPGAPARPVLMGENANVAPPPGDPPRKFSYDTGVPAIGKYWGYFDSALQTPCLDGAACPGGGNTKGCVLPGDPRFLFLPAQYAETVGGICPNGATGMVYNWYTSGIRTSGPSPAQRNPTFNGQFGSCTPGPVVEPPTGTKNCPEPPSGTNATNGRNVYVLNRGGDGLAEVLHTGPGDTRFYGTIVVEGIGAASPPSGPTGCDTANRTFRLGTQSVITTAQRNTTMEGSLPPGATVYVYGYPVVLIDFDPLQAVGSPVRPTVTPYAPQYNCDDMGSSTSYINGMVYSGGYARFNPLNVNGSIVAFEIQTQGSATYTYNSDYGNATPPPGFPLGSGNQVVIIRKSFIVCTNFSDDSGGGTACN